MDLRTRPKNVNVVEVASVPTALCSTRRYRSTDTRYTEVQKITTRMDEFPPALTNPRRRQKDNRPTGISGIITPRGRRDQTCQDLQSEPGKMPLRGSCRTRRRGRNSASARRASVPPAVQNPDHAHEEEAAQQRAHGCPASRQTSVSLRRGIRT